MKTILILINTLIITFTPSVFASGDHDHGAPTFQAPQGGILKSTHTAHFELVKTGNTLSIYVYDQKGKPLPTSQFKISAELEVPRKKPTLIQLKSLTNHWETIIESQSAHRITLKLQITDGKEKDNVKFTVENK